MHPAFETGATFEVALSAHRARLVRLCARLTGDAEAAEDLAQETLLESWRLAHKLRDQDQLAPWLAIARNVCLRAQRRRSRNWPDVSRSSLALSGCLRERWWNACPMRPTWSWCWSATNWPSCWIGHWVYCHQRHGTSSLPVTSTSCPRRNLPPVWD